MKIVGLVTEYNPFHNGHLHHLKSSLEKTGATHSIAIMSGQFLQRGVPALVDKWQRAQMAVEAGIDLVIELPVMYATGSAEYFAEGAVAHLDALGCVDSLCFGSESGSIDGLQTIAQVLIDEPPEFKHILKENLQKGLPYPTARSLALVNYIQDETIEALAASPNNILGIEYIKAILRLNSTITPHTVTRLQAGYHSTELQGNICSATAIRNHLVTSNRPIEELEAFMPQTSYKAIYSANMSEQYSTLNDYYSYLRYRIHTMSLEELRAIKDVGEGLENLIKASIKKADNIIDFIDLVKSKRYTQTRIQRILIHILLSIKATDYPQQAQAHYIRILAMNNKGKEILSSIRKTCETPIITTLSKLNSSDSQLHKVLDQDILATDIYMMNTRWNKAEYGLDYTTIPFIQK